MKTFHCDHCQNLVFFENVSCLSCHHTLAFLPDRLTVAAMAQEGETWHAASDPNRRPYRLCGNYTTNHVCNWAIPGEDPEPLCVSCRLTTVIPDLTVAGNLEAWGKLESAKRRMLYTVLTMALPFQSVDSRAGQGLSFQFLSDVVTPQGDTSRVLTGHDNGLITINVAEADDLAREQQRLRQHEPYRTLLGHFRHEVGHYYWDRLVQDGPRIDEFRRLFGDERSDYGKALEQHYSQGPPADWQLNFISAYATSHPWEDWAETWAHAMHILDALETAQSAGLSLRPQRSNEPELKLRSARIPPRPDEFDDFIAAWLALTYVLNNLTRGLGLADGYPFVMSDAAIAKLRFVFQVIGESAKAKA